MGSSYTPVLIHPRESEGHKLDFLFPLLTSTVCSGGASYIQLLHSVLSLLSMNSASLFTCY